MLIWWFHQNVPPCVCTLLVHGTAGIAHICALKYIILIIYSPSREPLKYLIFSSRLGIHRREDGDIKQAKIPNRTRQYYIFIAYFSWNLKFTQSLWSFKARWARIEIFTPLSLLRYEYFDVGHNHTIVQKTVISIQVRPFTWLSLIIGVLSSKKHHPLGSASHSLSFSKTPYMHTVRTHSLTYSLLSRVATHQLSFSKWEWVRRGTGSWRRSSFNIYCIPRRKAHRRSA